MSGVFAITEELFSVLSSSVMTYYIEEIERHLGCEHMETKEVLQEVLEDFNVTWVYYFSLIDRDIDVRIIYTGLMSFIDELVNGGPSLVPNPDSYDCILAGLREWQGLLEQRIEQLESEEE